MRARYVAALEFATGRRAHDPRQAVAGRLPPGGRRAAARTSASGRRRSAFAMVGDDLSADVAAAQRVGLRGILVLSGKTDRAEAERAASAAAAAGRTPSPPRWPTSSPR